jgi:hypothetical protein
MTTRYLATALIVAALTARAQSPAELLQKGIYTQETAGDLDGAIQIYRRLLIPSTGVPQLIAAQAQYQLVLSMLQKGDRAAAAHELDLLTRNFPDQQDLVDKARKLIPGAGSLLAEPWIDGEASQLNIKRGGEFTGEYLYFTAEPWRLRYVDGNQLPPGVQAVKLSWELKTKTSDRTISVVVDRENMRRLGVDRFDTDDVLGDASAVPFIGPLIDAEPAVFRMRSLPLSAGYKTTLTILPYLIGHGVPHPAEMTVTAVETVQTVAGKFNCYKVSFPSLSQTFWIGVDGARPLVKFQSGDVSAELVHFWGPEVRDDALSFLKKAGWKFPNPSDPSVFSTPDDFPYGRVQVSAEVRLIYTPPSELDQAAQRACNEEAASNKREILPGSLQVRSIAGHPVASCIVTGTNFRQFHVWVFNSSMIVHFTPYADTPTARFRWVFEPLLETIRLPKD